MKKLLIWSIVFIHTVAISQEIKFGKVSKEELEEKAHPIEPNADAAYLYKKRRTYFEYDSNKGFMLITEVQERIKIYTQEGFKYATKKINYYKPKSGEQEKITNVKAYTFNLVDGEITKQKLNKKDIFDERLNKYRGQKKITFPEIKEGTVIDFKYKSTSPSYYIKTLYFQYGIPVNRLEAKVEIPEYYMFNKRSKGYYSVPLRESAKRGTINFGGYDRKMDYTAKTYSFTQSNIPSVDDSEPYCGNINNYRGGIEFELSGTRFPNSMFKNYSTSWEDLSKQIYKSSSFGGQLDKTSYFKDDLAVVTKDAANGLEKVIAVFNFVKSKVKWNEYNSKYVDEGVKRAYKDGVGNVAEINLILTAMLREAGLDANPVLVSTRSHGIPLFPTSNGFNYVISKVNFPNQTYILLDATEKYATPNMLPVRCLNWNGREILKDGKSAWINLTPEVHAKKINTLFVKVNDDTTVNGMLRTTLTNHGSMLYRQRNNVKKEEDLISEIEDDNNIETEGFKILNKEDLSKNVVRSYKFEGEDFVEEINGKLYINPLLFLAEKENPFKSNERNFPVDFIMPWQDKHTVTISIPKGYKVESVPEALGIALPDNLGVFKFQISQANGKVKALCTLQMNSNIISPEHYVTLKGFYKQLVAKQNEKIVLVKS
ncbi:transglutaminase domain-containing protein [Tenacibaculum sp. 190524A02b]|uniref:transglutaminase domain-containing protein n=1 Tax=Tenacibaculum vairaonense TaxID=3137860 RepID=UPI0031FB2988